MMRLSKPVERTTASPGSEKITIRPTMPHSYGIPMDITSRQFAKSQNKSAGRRLIYSWYHLRMTKGFFPSGRTSSMESTPTRFSMISASLVLVSEITTPPSERLLSITCVSSKTMSVCPFQAMRSRGFKTETTSSRDLPDNVIPVQNFTRELVFRGVSPFVA